MLLVWWFGCLFCCVVLWGFSSYSLRIWLGWRFVVVVDCYDFGLCVIGLRLICWVVLFVRDLIGLMVAGVVFVGML